MRDPVEFAILILGHRLWATQAAILRSVFEHPKTSVKGCHGSSKTFAAAEAALCWLFQYLHDPDGGIVITTGPTGRQVERLVWAEIRKAISTSRITGMPPLNRTSLELSPDHYALGIAARDEGSFAGFHAANVLVVVDEAVSVRGEIYDAIDGLEASGKVHQLWIGNPTRPGGPFYDSHTKDRALWNRFTIDAFDTPNLAGVKLETLMRWLDKGDERLDDVKIPYLVRRRWVAEKYRKWGPDHPWWFGRVLAKFPLSSEYSLIHLDWIEDAEAREPEPIEQVPTLRAGVDVAGPGEDETVLYVLESGAVRFFRAYAQRDPRGAVLRDLRPFKGRLEAVNVDAIGIGWNFGLHLRDHGYPVRLVNVSKSPLERGPQDDRSEEFANLRAQLHWDVRERFELGEYSGLVDEETCAQLAALQWFEDPRGRIAIRSKDYMRSKGIASPDRAEGFILASADMPEEDEDAELAIA